MPGLDVEPVGMTRRWYPSYEYALFRNDGKEAVAEFAGPNDWALSEMAGEYSCTRSEAHGWVATCSWAMRCSLEADENQRVGR